MERRFWLLGENSSKLLPSSVLCLCIPDLFAQLEPRRWVRRGCAKCAIAMVTAEAWALREVSRSPGTEFLGGRSGAMGQDTPASSLRAAVVGTAGVGINQGVLSLCLPRACASCPGFEHPAAAEGQPRRSEGRTQGIPVLFPRDLGIAQGWLSVCGSSGLPSWLNF